MTHDELLAAIDDPMCRLHNGCKSKALRSVVELHKPYWNGACAGCSDDYANENIYTYPCPTIQAIEKELA